MLLQSSYPGCSVSGMSLKYMYGVNAWKNWVQWKNSHEDQGDLKFGGNAAFLAGGGGSGLNGTEGGAGWAPVFQLLHCIQPYLILRSGILLLRSAPMISGTDPSGLGWTGRG